MRLCSMEEEKIIESWSNITRYSDQGIFLGDVCIAQEYVEGGALLFSCEGIFRFPGYVRNKSTDLLERSLELSPGIDFLLLGMGSKLAPPPTLWREFLSKSNVGIEINDHFSAYRAYNILLSDARRFAMLLLPYGDDLSFVEASGISFSCKSPSEASSSGVSSSQV